jgi:hypothetical protein
MIQQRCGRAPFLRPETARNQRRPAQRRSPVHCSRPPPGRRWLSRASSGQRDDLRPCEDRHQQRQENNSIPSAGRARGRVQLRVPPSARAGLAWDSAQAGSCARCSPGCNLVDCDSPLPEGRDRQRGQHAAQSCASGPLFHHSSASRPERSSAQPTGRMACTHEAGLAGAIVSALHNRAGMVTALGGRSQAPVIQPIGTSEQ